jgi:hypothetical protein
MSFGVSVLGISFAAISGQEPQEWPSLLLLFGWLAVSAVIGWCLQGCLVFLFSRYGKSKHQA